MPGIWELKNRWDWLEVTAFSKRHLPPSRWRSRCAPGTTCATVRDFDLVQDNQCLGYGLLAMERSGLPVLGTIHHPITVDRRLEMEHAGGRGPVGAGPLVRVHQDADTGGLRLRRVITVSKNSYEDIVRDHDVSPSDCSWCPWAWTRSCSNRMDHVQRRPTRSSPPHHRMWR